MPLGQVGNETVIGRFLSRAAERASQPLWYHRKHGRWQPTTWAEARDAVVDLAAGLASLGIQPGERVGLMGANRPEWVICDYAIQHLGAVAVPLYVTSSADQIAHILTLTRTRVCLAHSDEVVGRIREAAVPGLQTIVAMHLEEDDHEGILGGKALVRRGRIWRQQHPDALADRVSAIDPEQPATVVFTSGTGGDPKGAVLTHRNLVWTAEAAAAAVGTRAREIILSYLPLAHALERVVTTVIPLVAPGQRWTCWFVEDTAHLPSALRSVRPTIFLAVPLVWARIQGRIMAEVGSARLGRRRLLRMAVSAGESAVRRRDEERPVPIAARAGATLARLLGRRVLQKVGLDRCWFAVSGAAPLQPQTQQFFQALGLSLHQGWGLTETTALCTVQRPDDLEVGAVGDPLDGVELRLGMDGEVLVRGPNVFAGYEAEPARDREVFDSDGFFHTGDVGRLADRGRLEIVDRVKDVIITAGGRKVSPRTIEEKLRADSLIAGAMVLGEGRPYLIALISLDGKQAATLVGAHPDDDTGLWEHPRVQQRVARTVAVVNRSLPEPDQVQNFAILPFGFPDEALTPTLKLKRQVVESTFAGLIEGLYA